MKACAYALRTVNRIGIWLVLHSVVDSKERHWQINVVYKSLLRIKKLNYWKR